MALKRMDNAGIVVDELAATIEFFRELGLELEGRATIEGEWANLNSASRLRASMCACRSRTNADDRLSPDPRGRVECGDGVVEGRDVADVRPQSSVPHPLDDLT